jgi:hypothetical protein
MRVSTSSALVGAAILSTRIYPLVAMRLRRDRVGQLEPDVEEEPAAGRASATA